MNMGMGLRILSATALAVLVSACASSQERASCEQRDWFELGRNDGAQGSTQDKLKNHARECSRKFRSDWETMYANGRNAGLAEYCTAENAFELGKMGIAYLYVCPSTMESAFIKGYRQGQRTRELELENKKLEGKIESISEQLNTTANDYDKERLVSELNQLQNLKAKNESELNRTHSQHQ